MRTHFINNTKESVYRVYETKEYVIKICNRCW